MANEAGGSGALRLDSYTATVLQADEVPEAINDGQARLLVTLHGGGFVDRAMPLTVIIADVFVSEYGISEDGGSLLCYVKQMPADGGKISAGYMQEDRVEMADPFSHSRVEGGGLLVG